MCLLLILDCPDYRSDIAVLLDSSSSIPETDFKNGILTFFKNLTDKFSISPSFTQFASVTFSSRAVIDFTFSQHMDKNDLNTAIDGITYIGGDTEIDDALRAARVVLFQYQPNNTPAPSGKRQVQLSLLYYVFNLISKLRYYLCYVPGRPDPEQ